LGTDLEYIKKTGIFQYDERMGGNSHFRNFSHEENPKITI
jgi:hypothetical protein